MSTDTPQRDGTRNRTRDTADLALLVGLNLVPAVGVLAWGWRSFDLIFLYWMENLVIGGFALLRMVARPYGHPLDLIFPIALAPFFVLHYGAFCWGHGTFIVSLFGDGSLAHLGLLDVVPRVLASQWMALALLALVVLHAADWFRDSRNRGFGADGVKVLMVDPYRRIVVLHLTVLASGFLLTALDEPVAGLLVLVAVKTGSDIWHWRHEDRFVGVDDGFVFTNEHLAEMKAQFQEPKVVVNGEERRFDSFAELKASGEFRMAQTILRIMGASEQLKAMNAYLALKIAEENQPGSGRLAAES